MAKLNNFRRFGRFTRDLFSRTAPASARKSLIFLDRVSAAWPATSDNAQSVNLGRAAGAPRLPSNTTRPRAGFVRPGPAGPRA